MRNTPPPVKLITGHVVTKTPFLVPVFAAAVGVLTYIGILGVFYIIRFVGKLL